VIFFKRELDVGYFQPKAEEIKAPKESDGARVVRI